MTQLFIDDKQVVLPSDFKITINRENTSITNRTDHTYDINIPLAFPENRAIFKFVDRLTTPLDDPTHRRARLIVERQEVISGEVVLLAVEPNMVSIQIVSKNTLWNGVIDPEVMFEDFPMCTPDKTTHGEFPEYKKSSGRLFADGSTCDMVHGVKYKGQQWMYVPTHTRNLVDQIDITNPISRPVYVDGNNLVKQFFLKPFLVALFQSKGYTFVDEFFRDPYDKLFIPTDLYISDTDTINLLLSGIKVVDFLTDLEKLFDITFVFSGTTVTAQPNSAISQRIHPLEVTDDYSMEVQEAEEALFKYKFPSEVQYKLHDTPTDISHWIDSAQTRYDLYMLALKLRTHDINTSVLYESKQGPVLILPSVTDEDKISANQGNGNGMEHLSFFHRYNQYKGVKHPSLKDTYECNVMPAGMYLSSLEVAHTPPDDKLKIYYFHTACQRPIAPNVSHNPAPGLIDEILNGRKPRFKIDYVNLAFFIGWIKAEIEVMFDPSSGSFSPANIESVISITDYIDLLRMARGLKLTWSSTPESNASFEGNMAAALEFLKPYKKYTLRLEGEGGLKQSTAYDKVDYEHAYTFRFRSDVKIDPFAKFLIHGQPYIMETCELTATAAGVETFATGVFYKVGQ